MAETTGISWADATFNPWIGCTKVGPGCDACYAEQMMANRFHRVVWGQPGEAGTRVRTSRANWGKPLTWDRKAAANGTNPFVFCASLADVFDNQVDPEWRRDLFNLIRATPHLTWLLLTKRPQLIVRLYEETHRLIPSGDPWPRNAAIGCTVVTQDEADRDIPHLLAAKRVPRPTFAFLSMEPLHDPVDLTLVVDRSRNVIADVLRGVCWHAGATVPLADDESFNYGPRLDFVITGGETSQGEHRARPTDPDWFRAIRDACMYRGVAYHHKQMTEGGPIPDDLRIRARPGRIAC